MNIDVAELAGRVSTLARELGRIGPEDTEIATSPKTLIHRAGRMRVYRYDADKEPRLGPLLLCHGLIGRQTMTDLEPGRSFVAKLLEARVDVYTVDWGNPSRADRLNGMSYYVDRIGEAMEAVRRESEAEKAALLGICQGGTFALCHAALAPERLSGVALAIAPVDFHADPGEPGRGLLNLWLKSLPEELIEAFLEEHGNLPGRLTGAIFQNLTPARTLAKYTTDLIGLADEPDDLRTFLRMERWLGDRPDHPGAAARDWLIGLYRENRLAEGAFELGGRPVRLDAIDVPVLNIYGTEDHIVPAASSAALGDLLPKGHDYQEVAVPAGHVGCFVGRKGLGIVPPAVIGWLARLDG